MQSFYEVDTFDNTSGQGSDAYIPPEVKHWNWGAFFMTWIWGLKHRVYFSLLWFIPIIGWFLMPIVLGLKGSAWAWQYKHWNSIDEFLKTQRRWGIIGGIITILCLIVSTILIIVLILWIGPMIINLFGTFGSSFQEYAPLIIYILNLFGFNGSNLLENQNQLSPINL